MQPPDWAGNTCQTQVWLISKPSEEFSSPTATHRYPTDWLVWCYGAGKWSPGPHTHWPGVHLPLSYIQFYFIISEMGSYLFAQVDLELTM